jgi:spermidine synthase
VRPNGGAGYVPPETLPPGLRYLTPREVPQLFAFATDMLPVAAQPNRLNDQALVRYYEEDWARMNR